MTPDLFSARARMMARLLARTTALTSVLVLAPALSATAQTTAPDGTTALQAITLSGGSGAPTAPVDGYVAPTAQTATKTGTPVLETQKSVSVVTRDQIDDSGAQTLGQALATTAGVVAEPYGSDPRFDSPVLRGFEIRNSQYLNGLRLMRSQGAPSYETYGLERVEVLRGPSSVLYGAGSPAGIANMVQKHAHDADTGEVGLGMADDGDARVFFDANRVVSPALSYRLTGVVSDSAEQIRDLTNTRGYLGFAARWQMTDRTTVDILLSQQNDTPITPAGIPSVLVGTGNDRAMRDLYIGDPAQDRSDRRMTNIGYELRHELDSGWAIEQAARVQKFDWDYVGFYAAGGSTATTVNRGAVIQDEDSHTLNVDTRLTGSLDVAGMTHKLTFGVDVRRYGDNTATGFATASALTLGNPATIPTAVGAPWYVSRQDLTLTQTGAYVQDEVSAGNWRGTLALRHDRTREKGTSFNNFAGASAVDQTDSATTGHAGLSYVFDSGLAPYLSYATSFDPLLGLDIAGNKLRPTTGKQWELGLKYQPTGFDGMFTAAIFDLRQQNVGVTVTEAGITGTRQIGEVRAKGIELEALAQMGNGWTLKGAYAHTDAVQVGTNHGKRPANTPTDTASLWVGYDFQEGSAMDGLSLAAGARHIGARFGDNANTFALEGVTLVDLAANYAVNDAVKAQVNVTNLTDKVHVANCGAFGCYYGDGRKVQASLTYRW